MHKTGLRRMAAAALAAALMLGFAEAARAVPIEKDAIIAEGLDRKLLGALAVMIQANGYRCDSLKTVLPFSFSRGFKVRCNGGIYTYEVEDQGGNIVVRFAGSRP